MIDETELDAWYSKSLEDLSTAFEKNRKETKDIAKLEQEYFNNIQKLRIDYLTQAHKVVGKQIETKPFDDTTTVVEQINKEETTENPFHQKSTNLSYERWKIQKDCYKLKLHIRFHHFLERHHLAYPLWRSKRFLRKTHKISSDYYHLLKEGIHNDVSGSKRAIRTGMQVSSKKMAKLGEKLFKALMTCKDKITAVFKKKEKEGEEGEKSS